MSNAGGAGAASSSSDPSKKFEFLLKQTELFSHFMGETKAKSPLKVKEKAKGKGMYTNWIQLSYITYIHRPFS